MKARRQETNSKMKAYRREHEIDFCEMVWRCGTTVTLLAILENTDRVTHPNIAARVCKEYGLDVDDYNTLVHGDHRAEKLPNPTSKPGMKGYHGEA